MGGACVDNEIPLLSTLIYLFRDVASAPLIGCSLSRLKLSASPSGESGGRATRKTKSGGEFGWGGTSVKR